MTNREEITKRLLVFIQAKNWGKSDFARAAGIHRQNADRYLSGKSDPSKIAIKLMTEGLNLDWLLTGKGEMYEEKEEQSNRQSYKNALQTAKKGTKNNILSESEEIYKLPPDNIAKALGQAMCKEGIQEGDLLILDQERPAKPGDLVLTIKNGYPEIQRHRQGDPKPNAIIDRLIRTYRTPQLPAN